MNLLDTNRLTSDTWSDTMTTEKQDEKIAIRLESRLMEMARALIVERNTGTISEYIRGLIIADAVKQGRSLAGITIPGWLTDTLVELRLVQAPPRSSPPGPAEEKGSRPKTNEFSARDEGNKTRKKK
jgi:hypothetical protein